MIIYVDQLIDVVREATMYKTVLIPPQGWHDTHSEVEITYVDAYKLIEALYNLKG